MRIFLEIGKQEKKLEGQTHLNFHSADTRISNFGKFGFQNLTPLISLGDKKMR